MSASSSGGPRIFSTAPVPLRTGHPSLLCQRLSSSIIFARPSNLLDSSSIPCSLIIGLALSSCAYPSWLSSSLQARNMPWCEATFPDILRVDRAVHLECESWHFTGILPALCLGGTKGCVCGEGLGVLIGHLASRVAHGVQPHNGAIRCWV